MSDHKQLMYDIEVHNAGGIRKYFEDGGDPNEVHEDIPLFTTMVEMYLRSPRFKDCIRAFIDYGLRFDDAALLAVLADNAEQLEQLIKADPEIVRRTYTRHNNTFTPLTGATLLHYCAEYNHTGSAKVLVQYGANVNARAATDEYGFGGHTPLFNAVCQHNNNSADMLSYLLNCGADVHVALRGIIWGKGYEWETFIPAVNPISYTMMGLLPQMHRDPALIAANISLLIKHAYGIDYTVPNVPNAYLT